MANAEMQELVFDLRGRICPSTLLVAMKEMNEHRQELEEKSVQLKLLVENRDATVTIPEMARNMGYAVSLNKIEQYYQITIRAAA